MILRPYAGTTYYSPTEIFGSTLLMLLLPAFASVTTAASQLIPLLHIPAPHGIFNLWSMSKLFFLLSLFHGIRHWRLMIHPELEKVSWFEGPPLPLCRLFPGRESFWKTRILWEPLVTLAASVILQHFLIITSDLAWYLRLAAFMLAMKQFIAWYLAWMGIRQHLYATFVGPIFAKIIEGKSSADERAIVHLASLPGDLPSDVKRQVIANFARVVGNNVPPPESNEETR